MTLNAVLDHWENLLPRDLYPLLYSESETPEPLSISGFEKVLSLSNILVQKRPWLVEVMSGKLFNVLWGEIHVENRISKISSVTERWEDLFRASCEGSLSFSGMCSLIQYLSDVEELRSLYRTTTYIPKGLLLPLNGVEKEELELEPKERASLRSVNEKYLDGLVATFQRFHHVHKVFNSLDKLYPSLSAIEKWIEDSSGLQVKCDKLKEMQARLGDIGKWDFFVLNDVDQFYDLCRSVEPCLMAHPPELFFLMKKGMDLFEWLRSQPDDLDFQVFSLSLFFLSSFSFLFFFLSLLFTPFLSSF